MPPNGSSSFFFTTSVSFTVDFNFLLPSNFFWHDFLRRHDFSGTTFSWHDFFRHNFFWHNFSTFSAPLFLARLSYCLMPELNNSFIYFTSASILCVAGIIQFFLTSPDKRASLTKNAFKSRPLLIHNGKETCEDCE